MNILKEKSHSSRVAMILAAGFGRRMEEYTLEMPKPLLTINSYPLICYSLFLLYLWKTDYVVINLHYMGDKIKKFLKDFPYFPIYFSEEKDILGTAGGISYAIYQNLLNDYFVVINTDTIFFPNFDLYSYIPILKEHKIDHLLCLKQKKTFTPETNFSLKEKLTNQIYSFVISKKQKKNSFFYTGMSLFNVNYFRYYRDINQNSENNSTTNIFKKELIELLEQNPIFGIIYKGVHIDSGTKVKYENLKQKNLISNSYKKSWENFLKGWFG